MNNDPLRREGAAIRKATWQKLSRQIRFNRFNTCERCGAKESEAAFHCHHVLEPRNYPTFARDSENILVLCPSCHVETPDTIELAFAITFYAELPEKPRQRLLNFFLTKAPHFTDIIDALKGGDLFAQQLFQKKLLSKDKPRL
jgi:hypothetical protein